MKMLNYDTRELLLQNVRTVEKQPVPEHYTKTQYQYLCKLIRRKHVTKAFFTFLIQELFHTSDWKTLSYQEMYELIHVLTFYEYNER